MEGMTGYLLRAEALRRRARVQFDAVATLKETFAQEAQHLHRYDQARSLDALREKVAQEVSDAQRTETAASNGFTKVTLIIGVAKLALGSLAAAALRTQEHPISIGAQLAADDFARTKPFGTVAVTVGPGGVPDDVNVVALSQQARQSGKAESEVVAALEASGYRVMTPESFSIALNELKRKVLTGILALPVEASSLGRHHEGLPGSQ